MVQRATDVNLLEAEAEFEDEAFKEIGYYHLWKQKHLVIYIVNKAEYTTPKSRMGG